MSAPAAVTALPSGLRLVHLDVPGPVASIYLWFDAGTADELDGERGAAHLLEHMLFKGTARYGVGECAARIEALGGDLNAYTTWDQTTLHATVLAEHWEAALDVLVDMAWSATLDADELAREIPVVQEEIRGYDSDPDAVLEDALTARLFAGHPYGRPVLGTTGSVAAIDRDRLVAFWRRHYTAGRCVLAVAGPVPADALLRAAERIDAPTGPARAPLPAVPPPGAGIERLEREFETSLVAIGWPVPGDDGCADELAALDVLASGLGGGRASRLQAELRVGQRVVADAWCTLYTRRSAGSLEIGLAPAPERTADALAAALALVERVRAEGLEPAEVARARQSLLADLRYAEETVDAVAHEIAWNTVRYGDPDARDRRRRAIAAVDAEAVHRVARRWLIDPRVVLLDDAERPVPTLTPAPPARPAAPPRGVKALFSGPDDGWAHQGPLASIYLAFPGGKLLEPAGFAGLSGCWASMVTSGAGSLDSVAFAAELDGLSAAISAVAGRNTLGLHLSAPAASLRPAIALLGQVLLAPRFDADDWEREREEVLLDLDTLPDRPDEVLSRRVWRAAFPDHPWGRVRTRTTIGRISARRLAAFHQERITRSGLVLGVAGQVRPETVWDALGPHLERLPEGGAVPVVPPPGESPTGVIRSRAGQEQALVAWATRAPGMRHTDALQVAVGLLSAQAGRLFMALRERESLAYSVWARLWDGLDHGLLAVGLATEPAQAARAQRGLLAELDRLRADGPSDDELSRTVSMLLGQHGSGLQRASTRAAQLALDGSYGRASGIDAERARLEAVRPRDVRDALAALPEGFVAIVRP